MKERTRKKRFVFALRILISSHFPMKYLTPRLDQKQMHSHKNTDDLSDDGEYFEVRNEDSIQYAYPVPSSMNARVSSRICE